MSDSQSKIRDLQMIEQNLANISQQKQHFQSQLFEVESALKELKRDPTAYKIIGSIMVKADSSNLIKELNEKEEVFKLRMDSLEKQEKNLGEKAAALQKEVMEELKKEKNE
ncbi:prefoldin subunit beta [Candidatus Woesearchaeota archaeon]|nr:MAG: prefoldin subunit beta [Candidatus Woesearchaeota archaeon]